MPEKYAPRFGLSYGWDYGEDGWDVGYNATAKILDMVVNAAVISATTTAAPGSPAAGDCYVVPAGGTGAFSGHDHKLGMYVEGTWEFVSMPDGASVWVADESNTRVKVSGLWVIQTIPSNFSDLADTPADFTGQGEKLVAVNVGETALEFVDAPSGGASDFTGLTDTPANLTGQGEKLVAVNVGETALEFIDAPSGGASDFAGLSDTPASYSGQAGKVATVNNAEDGIEFVAEPYDVGGTYPGAPAASVVMLRYPFPRAATFPSGLTGSQGVAGTAATAQTDFDIQKDGVSVGTMRFAAAATTATFIMASATSFAVGDVMTIVAPATPDSTLADIGFALTGER